MADEYVIPESLFKESSWGEELPVLYLSFHLWEKVYFKDNSEVQKIIHDSINREPLRRLNTALKNLNPSVISSTYYLKKGTRKIMIPSFDEIFEMLPQTAQNKNNVSPIVIEEQVYVRSVKGLDSAKSGEEIEYRVTEYSAKNVSESRKNEINWGVVIDTKFTELSFKGEKVKIAMRNEWAGKEITVVAFFVSYNVDISQKTTVTHKGVILLFRGHSKVNGPRDGEVPIIISVFNTIKPELVKRGYDVIIDPQENYPNGNFGIKARQEHIKSMEGKVDIFIEIHANGRDKLNEKKEWVIDPIPSGTETYYPQPRSENPKSVFLAESIANAVSSDINYEARAIEDSQSGPESLGVLGGKKADIQHNVPAIVFETGYITNPAENRKMQDKAYINKLVSLVCNGVDNYFKRYPAGGHK